jgi:hypothetical protein
MAAIDKFLADVDTILERSALKGSADFGGSREGPTEQLESSNSMAAEGARLADEAKQALKDLPPIDVRTDGPIYAAIGLVAFLALVFFGIAWMFRGDPESMVPLGSAGGFFVVAIGVAKQSLQIVRERAAAAARRAEQIAALRMFESGAKNVQTEAALVSLLRALRLTLPPTAESPKASKNTKPRIAAAT